MDKERLDEIQEALESLYEPLDPEMCRIYAEELLGYVGYLEAEVERLKEIPTGAQARGWARLEHRLKLRTKEKDCYERAYIRAERGRKIYKDIVDFVREHPYMGTHESAVFWNKVEYAEKIELKWAEEDEDDE